MATIKYEELIREGEESSEEMVSVERAGGYAVLTMNDPDKLNVLSAALMVQLRRAAEELVADRQVRAIVLTGAGNGFSTGGDLRLMKRATEQLADPDGEGGSYEIWRWIREQFGGMSRLIANSDKAFVAAVNGPAAGVGLAFALTCDIVLASERAVLVPAFGRLGLIPEVGTSWALTRRVGYQRAFEFYVGGEHVTAERAAELGLVNRVVPHDELIAAARDWGERIAELPPHAVRMAKPLLRAVADMPWEHAMRMEEFAEPTCFTTAAFERNVEALLEAR
jgi:2-(1,2-epoxy-1,2-dihydrophenyl)acetyl-CoA isomerase